MSRSLKRPPGPGEKTQGRKGRAWMVWLDILRGAKPCPRTGCSNLALSHGAGRLALVRRPGEGRPVSDVATLVPSVGSMAHLLQSAAGISAPSSGWIGPRSTVRPVPRTLNQYLCVWWGDSFRHHRLHSGLEPRRTRGYSARTATLTATAIPHGGIRWTRWTPPCYRARVVPIQPTLWTPTTRTFNPRVLASNPSRLTTLSRYS
jgi:hypothetical protein